MCVKSAQVLGITFLIDLLMYQEYRTGIAIHDYLSTAVCPKPLPHVSPKPSSGFHFRELIYMLYILLCASKKVIHSHW